MVNSQNATKTMTVALSDAELSTLTGMAGLTPDGASPISGIAGKSPPRTSAITSRLQKLGLLAGPDQLAPNCIDALRILSKPEVEIKLVWGNSDRVNFSSLYATDSSDTMVAFSKTTGGSVNISYFISHRDITALVRDTIAFTELKNNLPLSYEVGGNLLPVLFAVLDLNEEAVLQAALNRTKELALDLSAEAVNRVLVDAKTSLAPDWYAPLGYLLVAQTLPNAGEIHSGLQTLQREGAINIGQQPSLSSPLAAFAYKAFPVISFFGATVNTGKASEVSGAQFGLIRALNTLLFVQRTADSRGERFSLKSIGTSEVPELLFNLATLPFETPKTGQPAANSIACPKCGTGNPAGDKFCGKCGNALTAQAVKFCPKCGDAVKGIEKFCDKCGTKLD